MQINRDSQTTFKLDDESLKSSLLPEHTQTIINSMQMRIDVNQIMIPKPNIRLNSLDVYRGLTMVGMIMVDDSGPHPPWFLDHASWNGLTPADLIFPSFLFIMGMAVPMATTKTKPVKIKNVIRIVALFLIGVFLNLLARKFTFDHFRILGILQRLSLCYAGILLIHTATGYGQAQKRILGIFAIFSGVLIYTSYMLSFSNLEIGCTPQKNLEQFCNFSGYIDRSMFGQFHMIYPTDPEGLFSNLTALFTTYVGYYFCLIMKDNKNDIKKTIKSWLSIIIILGLCIYPLTRIMPINKKLYSTSFAVFTSCTSGLTIILFMILIDILPQRNQKVKKVIQIITQPFIWLGRNPLFVFVMMDLLEILLIKYIIIDYKSVWAWFYKYAFKTWIQNDQICSVVFSLFFVLLWTSMAGLLYKKNIFIRL